MNVLGLIFLIIFYAVVFIVAIWARKFTKDSSINEMILGGGRIGFWLGVASTTASFVSVSTWTGYTEIMFLKGLFWLQPLFTNIISYLIFGFVITERIRNSDSVTIMDLFQKKYGYMIGTFFLIPEILTTILSIPLMLNPLGNILSNLLDIPVSVSITCTALFVGIYTSMGSMFAVAYTDVLQLVLMIFGIVLCVPFVVTNEAVDHSKFSYETFFGHIDGKDTWLWIDRALSLALGALTYQMSYQKILSFKTTAMAKKVIHMTNLTKLPLELPLIIIGFYARVTNWESIKTFNRPITDKDAANMLPLILHHLVPQWVSVFCLSAVAATALSTIDSVLLSASSTVARNVYKNLFRKSASEREVAWVVRIVIVVYPIVGTLIPPKDATVYFLLMVNRDLHYIIFFPHIMSILFWKGELNSYGVLASLFIGLPLHFAGGIPALQIPALIKYPGYDPENGQMFPYRTSGMIVLSAIHLCVSWLAKFLFSNGFLGKQFDILKVFPENSENGIPVQPEEGEPLNDMNQ